MLVDSRCSIHEHRPRTCHTYDCRIFPGTGLEVEDHVKALIARRARRLQFSFPFPADTVEHIAVRTAAAFLEGHGELLPDPTATRDVTKLAVLAVVARRPRLRGS